MGERQPARIADMHRSEVTSRKYVVPRIDAMLSEQGAQERLWTMAVLATWPREV